MTALRPRGRPAGGTRRATWHRAVGLMPVGYLAAIVVVAFVHPVLPTWRWLAIHLLLLGAATNAIVVWSAHFTAAVLRVPTPANRRAESIRLTVLNLGVVGVLVGATAGPPWLAAAGAGAVFAAVAAHLAWLVRRLRAALPAPLAVTAHYYLFAALALLTGVPAGAMMIVDDAAGPRLVLFHAHVNLLGWITLAVLGTLLTLWPTVLRTRMVDGAVEAARRALAVTTAGLALVALGVLTWWPAVAVAGLVVFGAGVLIVAGPIVATGRAKAPASFAAWSIAAAGGWLLIALGIDACGLARAGDPSAGAAAFDAVLVPLLVGFVAQVLLGSLAFLLPVVLGGGPVRVRERTAALDRFGAQRVTMANAALLVVVLPVPPYVRIAASLLVLAALVQFLAPAGRVLLAARSQP
jgi:hypothetical protein